MASSSTVPFVPIKTKASIALKHKAEESFKVTVFEPKKAALQKKRSRPPPPPKKDDSEKNKSGDDDDDEDDIDDIFSDAPRKKPKRKEDPTVFDMTKARRDIMKMGCTNVCRSVASFHRSHCEV